jgi:glucose-1-phosphate thymidylyltransferase
VIKGPAIIGKGCRIEGTYIGPYTAVGDNARIANTEIEDSIVMESTEITNAGRIVESLIGKGVSIEKGSDLPSAQRFVLGDSSQVVL